MPEGEQAAQEGWSTGVLTEVRGAGARQDGNSDPPAPKPGAAEAGSGGTSVEPDRAALRFPGTGERVRESAKRDSRESQDGDGEFTLNFNGTDIREVVKVVLGDLMEVDFALDPAVQGTVSLKTGRPLSREDLLPTLETLLRMNGAAVVQSDGLYQVIPVAKAMRGKLTPQLGQEKQPLPNGYRLQVVPLQYIGAGEMAEILKPLAPEGSIIRIDTRRNLLLLAGTGPEMGHLLETVGIFDVNWLEGMSVGFFPLDHIGVAEAVEDLGPLLQTQSKGALSGILKVVPIERANGLLVVTHQPEYLDQIQVWVERLDRLGSEGDVRLFVYPVQNGKAENLAALLSQLFQTGGSTGSPAAAPELAPGRTPTTLTSESEGYNKGVEEDEESEQSMKATAGSTSRPARTSVSGQLAAPGAKASSKPVRIVADTENNALLILSTPQQYDRIVSAIGKLDKVPLQVLVEATIAEVSLNGELKYGLQWFFKTHHGDKTGNWTLDTSLDSSESSGLGSLFPGFNYTLVDSADQVRAVLGALASRTRLKVLSSPSVMVLDNRTASIRVGDQVPVVTQQQQSTATNDAAVVNSVEYRDTGVLLSVTPRVNPGGLVVMDIEQEVSDVVETTTSGLDSPTIQQRHLTSSVAVQNGQTIVLGGLMRENSSRGRSGLPIAQDLPVLGPLFGQRDRKSRRTELVVLLTPKVISGDKDLRAVTEEFQDKLQGLEKGL